MRARSLPLWERGLKYTARAQKNSKLTVAPLVGAWIEIPLIPGGWVINYVAPLVGAWIEIHI